MNEVTDILLFVISILWVTKAIYHDVKGQQKEAIYSLVWSVWAMVASKI